MTVPHRIWLTLLLPMVISPVVRGSGLDLHWLWEDRCKDCHGHSADFARRHLEVVDGELRGKHRLRDLSLFLRNHYPAGMEVDALYGMLKAQATTPPRFREECSGCHESAAGLVRERMILRDGVLYSRITDEPIEDLLDWHADTQEGDVKFFTRVLTRIANEVYRP